MSDDGNFKKRFHDADSNGEACKKLRLLIDDGPISEPLLSSIIHVTDETKAHFRTCQSYCWKLQDDLFNKVFDGNWKESPARAVTLPEVTPRAFSIYAKWLDRGCFYMMKPDDRTYNKKLNMYFDEYNKLNECHQLADFLQATDFKDACIDCIIDKMMVHNEHTFNAVWIIYAYFLELSPHRQFTIDCTLSFWGKGVLESFVGERFLQDFHKDLIYALGSQLQHGLKYISVKEYFKSIKTCKCHEHVRNDKPCYKTRYKHLS